MHFRNRGLNSFILISLVLFGCKSQKEEVITTSADVYKSYSIKHKASLFNVPPGIASIFLDESKMGNAELKDLLKDAYRDWETDRKSVV